MPISFSLKSRASLRMSPGFVTLRKTPLLHNSSAHFDREFVNERLFIQFGDGNTKHESPDCLYV